MSFLDHALEYAARGWAVHALLPGTKLPATPHGVKDATTDPDKIRAMWANGYHDCNIGCCLESWEACAGDYDKGTMPDARPTVKTPHGFHVYWFGSLPPTASKVAPNVDTRGRDSYVVIPPSVVDGIAYEWINEPHDWLDLDPVPGWIVEKCAAKAEPRKANGHAEMDNQFAILKARQHILTKPAPSEGAGSDHACYQAAAFMRDLGLSEDTILELLVEWTGFEEDWLIEKIENVDAYAQNEPGCDPVTDWQAVHDRLGISYEPKVSESETLGDWTAHWVRSEMPEIEFFDTDCLIPKIPGGCVGIMFGERGGHKTNTALSMLAGSTAQRILYAAGEGAYGVERDRVAARPELLARLKILPRVPLFASPAQVQAFIDGNIEFKPEIVVIDTLATALAGEDENSSATASCLTDNGAAGMIRRAWGCVVIVIAHAGKDVERGVRGSSGFEANVDFVLMVKAHKEQRVIEVHAKKMRDAPDGQTVHYAYEAEGVPVPVRITEKEFKALFAMETKEEKHPVQIMVQSYLRLNAHHTWADGIETSALARCLVEQEQGPRPGETGEPGVADWDTASEKWRRALLNARTKAWAKGCYEQRVQDGGEKMIGRWYSTPPANPEY